MELVVFEDDDEPRAKWFPFDDDTEVQINYLSRAELKKINNKAAKAGRLAKRDVSDYSNCLLGRKAVGGWRKIKDHNHPGLLIKRQPFPFSPENLDFLMLRSTEFSRFVNEICIDSSLFGEDGEEDEAEVKND